jgi:hypothetical protein
MKLNFKTCGYGIAALTLMFGRYPLSWLLSNHKAKNPRLNANQQNHEAYITSPTGNLAASNGSTNSNISETTII